MPYLVFHPVFYQVSPKNFPVRAKCSPRINLYISGLPCIHFEFPSSLVNGTSLKLFARASILRAL